MISASDGAHLARCFVLARQGAGVAAPNPMVGAVVVRDGRVVGEGHHVFHRRDHAEVVALRDAGERARGATLYVNLEPCSTQGRTPACTAAILSAGIARVVVAMPDPDSRHLGGGLELLRREGVAVAVGDDDTLLEAVRLNAAFCKWVRTGHPLVTLKAATSLDGRISAASGESKWITGEPARARVHELRSVHAAILCGVGTLLADDPRLSVRTGGAEGVRPWRCVVDPRLRTPPTARVFADPEEGEGAGPVIVFASEAISKQSLGAERAALLERAGAVVAPLPERAGGGLDLLRLLEHVGQERRASTLFVEGGGVTSGRFLRAGLVDRLVVHLAPILLGGDGTTAAYAGFGAERLTDAVRLEDVMIEQVGVDMTVEAGVAGGFDPRALAGELRGVAREVG